ncbi:hypothetical protein C3L33_08615, partial [Rhododendron williamsianum]
MTYVVNDEEKDCVVPLLKPRDDNGDDCVKLGVSDDLGEAAGGAQQAASPVFVSRWCCLLWWAKMFVLLIFVGVLAAVFLLWGWLAKYPKKASMIRLAGEGNWLDQCRDVTLIRISPFPYIIYNYCAVATNVKYGPYLLGSLIGMVPEIFVAIYT